MKDMIVINYDSPVLTIEFLQEKLAHGWVVNVCDGDKKQMVFVR